jgi:hypothetical protein
VVGVSCLGPLGILEFLALVDEKSLAYSPEQRDRVKEIQEQIQTGGRNNLINPLKGDRTRDGTLCGGIADRRGLAVRFGCG